MVSASCASRRAVWRIAPVTKSSSQEDLDCCASRRFM
ncbi:hypothetical protein A2U01_0078549, partial [Trifolium medium]|nr:hypothetical protein [Trifolium medium]